MLHMYIGATVLESHGKLDKNNVWWKQCQSIYVIHNSAVGSFSKFFMLLGPNTLSKILTPITFNSNFSILLGKMAQIAKK